MKRKTLMNSEMIIASLSNIWHIVPIIIGIILLKKYVTNKDIKNRMIKNQENEKNGLTLELRTRKKYEELGYKITSLENENQGIDFIMIKNDKTLLVKCKNSYEKKSIKDEDIEIFCANANKYLETNNINKSDAQFRYVIPYANALHKSAIKTFADEDNNCKYLVL